MLSATIGVDGLAIATAVLGCICRSSAVVDETKTTGESLSLYFLALVQVYRCCFCGGSKDSAVDAAKETDSIILRKVFKSFCLSVSGNKKINQKES